LFLEISFWLAALPALLCISLAADKNKQPYYDALKIKKGNMKLFSILTITFNAQAYLKETLDSVLSQSFSDYEHIVWDGGSRDKTLEIIQSYPHVKCFQGSDSGISDAMNRAASKASGRYLIFLHADDLFYDNTTLQRLSEDLQRHEYPEWLYGRSLMINAAGEAIRKTPLEPYSAKRLRKYNFISHPSCLVSKNLFDKLGGFDVALRYCMDYDFWLKASAIATPVVCDAFYSRFREHAHSTSIGNPFKVTDEAYQIRNRYVQSIWERWRSYRTWKKRRAQSNV
jgi:glycosyltransferase involved in cell wall biosynthesis